MLENKDIVNFIAEGEGHTVEEAAENFGVSVSTIKKRLAQVRDLTNPKYDEIEAEKLKLAQMKVSIRGHKKGGASGKRGGTFTEEQARKLAELYLNSGLTFKDLSSDLHIPTSTLWDTIRSIKDAELQSRIDEHIKHKPSIIEDKEEESYGRTH